MKFRGIRGRQQPDWLHKQKYNILLISLLSLFIGRPFWQGLTIGALLTSIYFVWLMIIVIRTLIEGRLLKFYYFLSLCLFSIFTISLGTNLLVPSMRLSFIAELCFAIFLAIPIVTITNEIFHENQVDKDTIKGGICVYLLLGLFWASLYEMVIHLSPLAFRSVDEPNPDMVYFSFTTLSTLGYGDIVPVDRFARILSNLEAMTGILYPNIFIARLVSLYSQKSPPPAS